MTGLPQIKLPHALPLNLVYASGPLSSTGAMQHHPIIGKSITLTA